MFYNIICKYYWGIIIGIFYPNMFIYFQICELQENTPPPPLTIMNSTVAAVESFRFLGTIISQDLKWDNHVESMVKKAQKRLYFLHQLRKFNLPQELLKQFYSAIIASVLCTSISVRFSSATKSDLRRLRSVVRTAERIIGTTLRLKLTYEDHWPSTHHWYQV